MGALKHLILTRSAYGPGWSEDANRRRLAMTEGVTIRSLMAQTNRDFTWIVMLHRKDALLDERRAAYKAAGARFIYTTAEGDPSSVAFDAYRGGWGKAIGSRAGKVAMTRLDDDDGFAPWVVERFQAEARKCTRRTALICPIGIRVWNGGYTVVQHRSNAMHTLVTMPGETMTVYDYPHRFVGRHAWVRGVDARPAWVWSRHPDTISGWHVADMPLTDSIREMFPIDWSLFEGQFIRASVGHPRGRCFR
jgi:hypothetical protein